MGCWLAELHFFLHFQSLDIVNHDMALHLLTTIVCSSVAFTKNINNIANNFL